MARFVVFLLLLTPARAAVLPGTKGAVKAGQVRAWTPAFKAFASWAKDQPDLKAWASLSPLLEDGRADLRAAVLSPWAEALGNDAELRSAMLKPGKLAGKDRRKLIETLERARAAAAPSADALAGRVVSAALADCAGPATAGDWRARIKALGDIEPFLDASAGFFGEKSVSSSRAAFNHARSEALFSLTDLRVGQEAAKLGLSVETPAGVPMNKAELKAFLDRADKDIRPDMFLRKMEKASKSDDDFFRAFPNLLDLALGKEPAVMAAPRLFGPGDLHPHNTEIAAGKLQVNDMDDAGPAPSAADAARPLIGAALLGDGSAASYSEILSQAVAAYVESLKLDFEKWSAKVSKEKAVSAARDEDRDWYHKAGPEVTDKALLKRLFKLSGLDPDKWAAFDRMGAGLSSIGMERFVFASKKHKHAYELKELRESALVQLDGRPSGLKPGERVSRAYKQLRQVPVEVRFAGEGKRDFILRRREGVEISLDLSDPLSAARALGGLAAQQHRGQGAGIADLETAIVTLTPRLVLSMVRYMAAMREALAELLDEGSLAQAVEVDAVVVGAGAVGLAVARELSRPGRQVAVLERHDRYGRESSSRSSEVVHAGFYYPAGSLKARLCVEGRRLLDELCEKHGLFRRRTGKLVVAQEGGEGKLEALFKQGRANGVEGLSLFSRAEIERQAPGVSAAAALWSSDSGIFDSEEFMRFLWASAEERGVLFAWNASVEQVERSGSRYLLRGAGIDGEISAGVVVNCAGLESDRVAALAGIDPDEAGYRLHWFKGEYFALRLPLAIAPLVYPLPDKHGLGVHLTIDRQGRHRLGPNAFAVERGAAPPYGVDPAHGDAFWEQARRWLPALRREDLMPGTSGVRPKLSGDGSFRDFVIREESARGLAGWVSLAGIESPGLTASLAIAREVALLVG